jgi:UDP-2,3-diacylglucosamine pyrophosphatase LpxH
MESNSRRILHLSDLHFGTKYASRNKAYLLGRLEEIKHSIDRVVITGDLSDNPSERDADDFYDFRTSCQRISRNEPIVVPGNHDQRWLGNIAGGEGRLAELEWSPVVHDDDIRCVFFCFNSAIKGDFARGRITNRQFMRVATKFQNDGNLKLRIREYLRIALVHHHPFSYQVEPVTLIQRVLRKVKLTDEPFMRLEDSEDFVKWAARMNVEIILHGHMHEQIYLKKDVQVPEGWRSLCAVECGASLGAEGTSLTYNLISWDSSSKRWTVTFWADPGDGSGFSRQAIAVQEVEAEN